MADRRETFLAGDLALIRDLQKQSEEVEKWSEISVGEGTLLTERAKELPAFFGELARETEPFPPDQPPEVIVNAYKILLDDRVKELKLKSAKRQLLQRSSAENPLAKSFSRVFFFSTQSNQRLTQQPLRKE